MSRIKEVMHQAAISLYPNDSAAQDKFMRRVMDGKIPNSIVWAAAEDKELSAVEVRAMLRLIAAELLGD